ALILVFTPLFLSCFRALCCKGPPPPRPEYDVVCIGLTGAGKTSLLSRLCSEGADCVVPTTGFSIKAVPFPNAILNVKELGGADNIKKYWSRYYQGSQGVVFVLDSASSDEELEAARNELHSALQHPQLCTLPFLILANHQDKPAARTPNQVKPKTKPLATGLHFM
uniref:ADP-ribosylation factor-like protein 15 n=1 Tax=Gasterosteus aculeatus aculeatus TaxID=481459 RepID=A0AAQ4PIU0_GASAC